MKRLLLRVLEWHAQATRAADTWHEGRFLEEWADERVIAGLRAAYAHYDAEDVARALAATMDLFAWLARETAERLGLAYNAAAETVAYGFVTEKR